MQRPITCKFGILLAALAICLRLVIFRFFTSFGDVGIVQLSKDYQYMLAWIDLSNIAILSGLALAAIGWLVPSRDQD